MTSQALSEKRRVEVLEEEPLDEFTPAAHSDLPPFRLRGPRLVFPRLLREQASTGILA